MIYITDTLSIQEWELSETFIRASGPGGQNVNKVSSAVQLRFNVRHSPSLPEGVRQRLEQLARNRITKEGILVITADRFRSQEQNRQDARDRLITLIQRALIKPEKRIATAPTRSSKEKRLHTKAKQGTRKKLRQSVNFEGE
ncbi:alternative ribosome rescue aminoacyl-tRNA hydrolase ArfB [Candidatus Paracaedibacter symbiosus]|uniref:alternative ribosome rescue aminoacyl-tRNA hydrolase ArfB n=1 Tax=Candidatus Paracaedibacter symbiosus TaxID=244582 RepID=UPI000509CAB2|nr:alternative ribosome rescue aminoacyl-tRNA hydrolase ArfB [Candidatus Paracaedibacter symbiosus]